MIEFDLGMNTRRINSFLIALKEINEKDYNKLDEMCKKEINESMINEYISKCDLNNKRILIRRMNEIIYQKEEGVWKDEWQP